MARYDSLLLVISFGALFRPQEGQRMGKMHLKMLLEAVSRGCAREACDTDAKVLSNFLTVRLGHKGAILKHI